MSFIADDLMEWWFVHTAVIKAPQSEILDEDGHPEGGWLDPITITACRLQDITMAQLIAAKTAGIEVAHSVLLVPLGTPTERRSQITEVRYKDGHELDGVLVDAGPFEVIGALTQRSVENEYHQLLLRRFR